MALIKISDLSEETTPADGDLIPIVDVSTSATKKTTRTNLFKNPPLADSSIDFNMISPGMVVQESISSFTAVATGTTVIPLDDTIPQITEGIEFMTLVFTPKSATNILVIEANVMLASSVANNLIAALFQGATANALAVGLSNNQTANSARIVNVTHSMVAGTTSGTTFRIRGGGNAAGTTTFNGASAARLFGAITKSTFKITEYKV